jgi:predicted P-loop ATPase
MPVLIGTHQGEGKSTLVRWIAMSDEWFGEINEIDGQKGIEALEGIWICEMAEMLAMVRAKEQEAMKAFVTRQRDRYRHPFDKRVTEHPRQCIFIGTTNKRQFLTDKTGNRRFYPVEVRQSGYDLFNRKKEIKEYIQQCWAEARAKIDTEFMQPFANRELIPTIREQQEAAVEDDYRVGLIRAYLDEQDENGKYIHDEVCILELLKNVLSKDSVFSKPSRRDSDDIALILSSFDDYEKAPAQKRFAEFGKQRFWARVNPEPLFSELPF